MRFLGGDIPQTRTGPSSQTANIFFATVQGEVTIVRADSTRRDYSQDHTTWEGIQSLSSGLDYCAQPSQWMQNPMVGLHIKILSSHSRIDKRDKIQHHLAQNNSCIFCRVAIRVSFVYYIWIVLKYCLYRDVKNPVKQEPVIKLDHVKPVTRVINKAGVKIITKVAGIHTLEICSTLWMILRLLQSHKSISQIFQYTWYSFIYMYIYSVV